MIQVHDAAGVLREPPLGARLLAAFELQERVELAVAPLLAELVRSIPRLRTWRRFSSGAWVLGVRTPAEEHPLDGRFARLDFEIRIDALQHAVTLTCRTTVRSRDGEAHTLRVVLDAAGEVELRHWAEHEALEFAAAYWGRGEGDTSRISAEQGAT